MTDTITIQPPSATDTAPGPELRRWWILASLGIAQSMLIIDVTVLNVALPSIGDALRLDRAGLTWIATAYTLFFGSLLLLGGRLSDAFGRRRTFLVGLGLFTAASLSSGLAPDGTILLASRIAQGIGAALLSPAALSIVTTTFDGSERTRALAVWAALSGAGAAVGVVLGGVLTTGIGWQWIFFINVPIGLAVIVAVMRLVPAAPPPARIRYLDVPGALAATATMAFLLYGLIGSGDSGWTSISVIGPIGLAAAAAAIFIRLERGALSPLVRLDLLARGPLRGALPVTLTATALLAGSFFLASLYLQRVIGLSAIEAGLAFLPAALGIIVGAQAGAHALDALGPRSVGAFALLVSAIGARLLAEVPIGGDAVGDVIPGLSILALGLGAALVTANASAFVGVTDDDAGMTSGAVSTTHELGFALGVSVISTAAGASLAGHAGFAGGGIAGYQAGFMVAALVALIGAGLAFHLLPRERPMLAGRLFAH
jgi:EmrB/QacA subfamily drug resistance transporter